MHLSSALAQVARRRPLSLHQEQTVASWPDRDVRYSWAAASGLSPEVVSERLGVEDDPQVLHLLLRAAPSPVPARVLVRLCSHPETSVALAALLDAATPDALAASTLRRLRHADRTVVEVRLLFADLSGAATRPLLLAELVSHLDLRIAAEVAQLCTDELSQRALLARLRSLSDPSRSGLLLVRRARTVAFVPALAPRAARVLSSFPDEPTAGRAPRGSSSAEVRRRTLDRAALLALAASDLPGFLSVVRERLSARLDHFERTHLEACVDLVLESEHSLGHTFALLDLVGGERPGVLVALARRPDLTALDAARLLASPSGSLRPGPPAGVVRTLAERDPALLLAAARSFPAPERDRVLEVWARYASAPDLALLAAQVEVHSSPAVARSVLSNESCPLAALLLLPAGAVLSSSRAPDALAAALDSLTGPEFEVLATLCSDPSGTWGDLVDAARAVLARPGVPAKRPLTVPS